MRLREGKLISEWLDEYENRALIEEVEIKPHKGGTPKKAYRLSCYADYDEDFCYYVSIFDSVESAENQLKKFSCGSFENVLILRTKNILRCLENEHKNFINMSKNNIEKIKTTKVIDDKEKTELINVIKRIGKAYIDNLADRFIIDPDEAKILYAYLEK